MASSQQSLIALIDTVQPRVIDPLDTMQREVHASRLNVARPSPPIFDGRTFDPVKDEIRLKGQLARVFNCMKDGRYRTLSEIRYDLSCEGLRPKDSEAGISARLRDLRKKRWGSHVVNRRRRGKGLWEYQVIVNG